MTQVTLPQSEAPSTPTVNADAPARRRHRRPPWLAIAIGTVLALFAGVIGFRAWLKQPPEKVTVEQAVDRYRSTASSTTASSPALQAPAPGVYVFSTSGQESVDALGGDTHTYPAETTIMVTLTDCGFRMSWIPLSGRWDTTDVCGADGGFAETTVANAHEFFRISQVEHFVSEPGSWWLPPNGVTQWTSTSRSDGGRTTVRTGRLAGQEQVPVGTEVRPAVHVRFDDTITGSSTGTSSTDLWLDPSTGLPLRETSTATTGNDTIVGHVEFHESIDLRLVSTTPNT